MMNNIYKRKKVKENREGNIFLDKLLILIEDINERIYDEDKQLIFEETNNDLFDIFEIEEKEDFFGFVFTSIDDEKSIFITSYYFDFLINEMFFNEETEVRIIENGKRKFLVLLLKILPEEKIKMVENETSRFKLSDYMFYKNYYTPLRMDNIKGIVLKNISYKIRFLNFYGENYDFKMLIEDNYLYVSIRDEGVLTFIKGGYLLNEIMTISEVNRFDIYMDSYIKKQGEYMLISKIYIKNLEENIEI